MYELEPIANSMYVTKYVCSNYNVHTCIYIYIYTYIYKLVVLL